MKKAEPYIHEYWARYIKRTLFFVISMQIIAVLVGAVSLLIAGLIDPGHLLFWITLAIIIIAVIAINIIVTFIITEPLKQIVASLSQTAGEKSPLIPPHLNAPRYEKNGLKPILQAIYDISLGNDRSAQVIAQKNNTNNTTQFDLETALSTTSSGIAFFDEHGTLLYANSHVPTHQEDGTKKLELEFYTDETFEQWLEKCRQNEVHAERVWARIANRPVGQNDRRIYDLSASYHKGSTVPVSLVLIDRTNQYGGEEDDLNFVSFAAHELRGPITVIRGYLDALNDELSETIDIEQKELFKRLIVSANRLDTYIKNILNSSKYDRRHFSVHLRETRLSDVYDLVADDMQLRASAQHRLLTIDIPSELPTIAADPSTLSEVLANLIDNAIKYSNEGGQITLRAEQHGTSLEVEVQDYGIGMPANVVNNLFHKFYRSHRSRETVAGTGIGLYISKAIVESHGGTMSARSVEGEGSTFSFTIPLYSAVADDLARNQGDNQALIEKSQQGSWIKNHGNIRG